MTSHVGTQMDRAGYPLPTLQPPKNRFIAGQRVGVLLYTSSVTPLTNEGAEIAGKIGRDLTEDAAKDAARWCVAHSLACVESVVPLDSVAGVADMLVFCNVDQHYSNHSLIADAASELLEHIFGSSGQHTRGAIGASSLVRNVPVVVKVTYVLKES
jgi:hypothetical protein